MHNNHSGFTLIELSIVLVIVGILIGMGSKMLGPMITFAKVRETRDLQDSAIQSIFSQTASTNSLPNKDTFSTVAKSAKDAWNQDFVFMYYSSLSRTSPTKDTICGRLTTPLTMQTDPSDATTKKSNVAFAILSRADNLAFTSTLNGTLNGATYSDAVFSTSGHAVGDIKAALPNGDIIRWVSLDELRSKIGCQGAQLKILNNELPFGKVGDKYSARVMADGGNGSGSYQWRVKGDTPLPGITNNLSPVFNSPTLSSATFMNITGHPTQAGSYLFTVDVQDSIGNANSKSFVMTINP